MPPRMANLYKNKMPPLMTRLMPFCFCCYLKDIFYYLRDDWKQK